jgi:hypothetical protein
MLTKYSVNHFEDGPYRENNSEMGFKEGGFLDLHWMRMAPNAVQWRTFCEHKLSDVRRPKYWF